LVALLGLIAWFIVGLDQWVGVTVHPLFIAFCFVIGAVPPLIAWVVGGSKLYLIPLGLFVLFLGIVYSVDFNPVKPFLRALNDIQAGMSHAQVHAIIDSHFPSGGRFNRPALYSEDSTRIHFGLDPTDGRWNAAILTIYFEDDVVSYAEFQPD
jgi:hypothetical protein